ncbi:MAG: SH3 domain-containing protein [Hyphomicrobiaceae bacterium]|nr:SH3 domain-containing protein [Hyphomicrobiaceae bacterium]
MKTALRNLILSATAGLVILGAAFFAISPAMAAGYNVFHAGQVINVDPWDNLNVRLWPASYSQKIGQLPNLTYVYVERCIKVENSSDWCKIGRDGIYGWVNSRFLHLVNL